MGLRPERLAYRRIRHSFRGMERPFPRLHTQILADRRESRARRRTRRNDHARHGHTAMWILRPVRHRPRPRFDRLRELCGLPRRLHHRRPDHVQEQTQRGQRRKQPRRNKRQPFRQFRPRGPQQQPNHRTAAPARHHEPAGHAPTVVGHANAARRRRIRQFAKRQQQRLHARQRHYMA